MIDVLLPFYGDPDMMRQTVASVRAQTSRDWRLVVVDDGYPDPTIATWFADLGDDRIEYHRNEENLGANLNYMKALSLASAEYVVVMGADDLMKTRYLADLERAIATFPGVAIIETGVEIIDETNRVVRPLVDRVKSRLTPSVEGPRELSGESLMVSLLRGNWTYFPSLCWRRDVIEQIGFRPDFHVVQDLGLLLDVLRGGGSMALCPEVAFQYRRHTSSDSSLKTLTGERFAEERHYFRTIADELGSQGLVRAERAARRHLTSRLHAAALVPSALSARKPAAAQGLLRHALAKG
ncbi:glycosyltransferase involved in cell wall biosynthesis [Marmoricola sp. OAE513]|uniref:glycosyltransferase family 2 protein n=1 Tax=Marmoricola sp. OAE513 TaxID=2817894 RepID=UPI001AE695FE